MRLADRVGRRVTLLGGTLATAAIMVALAYARLTAVIVVLVLLLGVTLEAPRPVTQALVADLVPDEDRARAYAALFWVSNHGFGVAMTSAGFLANPRLRRSSGSTRAPVCCSVVSFGCSCPNAGPA